MQEIRNKRVTVAGLGRFGGGIAVARWLVDNGAAVLVTDQAPPEKLGDSVAKLDGLPIEFRLGEQREEDFTRADLVVASPAVAPSSPYLKAARAAGVPVTTEVRLFAERCPATVVGVTGTKGKSTTTAMLGEILRRGSFTTWVGGNIGHSLLPDLPRIDTRDVVVLELSSFMLAYLGEMRWSPHVALVTMVTRDHLEWHGSFEAYLDAKRNIVRYQRPDDFAVLCEDDPLGMSFRHHTKARVVPYGVRLRRPFELLVPGMHNQLNAHGAFAAAQLVGVDWETAQAALKEFRGLPHRLQLVHDAGGVRYYNDSIATIPEAAVAALESFPPKRVIQIVGGYDKGLPLTPMCNALVERAKAVLCIGDTGRKIAGVMAQASHQGGAAVYDCGDLPTAMTMARSIATAGDVVLLSTGCASYGQFDNFEQRGDLFTRLAREG